MKKIGSLYCLDQDGSLRKAEQGIGISNGLAWSSDGKSMYYIDSSPRQMYKYDFDPSTGKIGNSNILFYFRISRPIQPLIRRHQNKLRYSMVLAHLIKICQLTVVVVVAVVLFTFSSFLQDHENDFNITCH